MLHDEPARLAIILVCTANLPHAAPKGLRHYLAELLHQKWASLRILNGMAVCEPYLAHGRTGPASMESRLHSLGASQKSNLSRISSQ